ncbi:hypothetical protein BLA60_32595 [Actinophytocola xinjiangensis]|uniref:Pyrrolo-quinoline quinone repeat domain-containing protein n=1 Tax=Actinophytocola xinjiangensis TaxID=485602 RepID=A0A7Z1AV53_9PSEU|nr:PQQ-binding-like beta-propeller repeat protein [Actinophytocola xinjiangensis]OLF06370.1 hypothetical protein BLA60_32595 [Actinophytocola xinjiangensis]
MNRESLGAVLLTVAIVGSACTDEPPPPPPRRPSVAPLTATAEALWRGSTGRRNTPPDIEIRGDSVLVFGNTADELERQLLVADAETGRTRWRVDRLRAMSGREDRRLGHTPGTIPIVGTEDDWTAFLPYVAPDDTSGVAAVSGADGEFLWETPVAVRTPHSPIQLQSVAAGDRVVANGVRQSGGATPTQVVAHDSATGRRLWEATGIWPQFVVGDTLLAQAGEVGEVGAEPREIEPRRGATVVGIDALTGKRTWDLGQRYPDSKVFLTLAGFAVLAQVSPREYPSLVVIDAGTGATVAELGAGRQCVSDQERLIVCAGATTGQFAVFDVEERSVRRFTVSGAPQLDTAWHGYVTFRDGRVVDGSGTLVTDDLPGAVIALSDRYLVLYDVETNQWNVHRR